MTSSVVDLGEAPKHFPKPNLHQKKLMVEIGGLLPVWSTTAFWIPAKPLHLRSMLSKSMRCPENCNTHSQHWSTKRAQVFSMTTPNCTSHNQPSFKSWMNWATKFCLILRIHLTSHQPPLLQASWQLFAGKTLPPTESRNCFPRVHRIPKHRFLCYRNKLISCWQNCVDCNGSYFD